MNTESSEPSQRPTGLALDSTRSLVDNLDPISKKFLEFAVRYIGFDYSIENYAIPCICAYHPQPKGRTKAATQLIGGFAYAASVARTAGILVVRTAEIELKLSEFDIIVLEFMSLPPSSESSAIQRTFDQWFAKNSDRTCELTGYVKQQLTQRGGFVCMGNSKRSNAKPTKQTLHWLPLITELIDSVLYAPEQTAQNGGRQSKSRSTPAIQLEHDSETPNE